MSNRGSEQRPFLRDTPLPLPLSASGEGWLKAGVRRWYLLLALSIPFTAGAKDMFKEIKPVSPFDLSRYLGKWYEIARLPAWFEKDMTHVTATYTLKKNGRVKVENAGKKNGKPKVAIGKAKFGSEKTVGYLKVAFFLWFYADYKIIDIDTAEYKYAMVGSSYDYLWILCREPKLSKAILNTLIEKAQKLGFDTNKLYYTPQE
jgi:lipocalin